ncbi:hypothetical protein [Oenococcus sp.]|uniref:hypothetical protein n=1 Tax=Oenococcus sp. TaxID=1979414 RepID=UPI0039E7F214
MMMLESKSTRPSQQRLIKNQIEEQVFYLESHFLPQNQLQGFPGRKLSNCEDDLGFGNVGIMLVLKKYMSLHTKGVL